MKCRAGTVKSLIVAFAFLVVLYVIFKRLVHEKTQILVVHELAPHSFSGSNFRIRQVCQWLSSRGFSVTLAFRDSPHPSASAWAALHGITLLADDVSFSKTLSSDMVTHASLIILGVWFYRPLRTIPETFLPVVTGNKVILLTDDVHSFRCLEELNCPPQRHALLSRLEGLLYSSPKVSLVVTVSQQDAHVIQTHFSALNKVTVLPMLIERRPLAPRKKEGKVFLFLASYHDGNIVVGRHLLGSLWPQMLQDGRFEDVTLVVVGNVMLDPTLSKLGEQRRVVMLGQVEDVENVVLTRNTVMIAWAGVKNSGISTKVFFALEHALPVVTNEAGLRGLTAAGVSSSVFLVELEDDLSKQMEQIEKAFRTSTQPKEEQEQSWEKNEIWMNVIKNI